MARKKHVIHKTQSSRDALTLASRSYKRTMNIFVNKYKFTQQSKQRKMQKGQPKNYWNFLNSLKNRKISEAPPLKEFYDYFKNIYSEESNGNFVDDSFLNVSYNGSANEFLNQPFTCEEIDRCIKRLKNSKAPGGDEILNEYLKLLKFA